MKISGEFDGWTFYWEPAGRDKLIEILSWGCFTFGDIDGQFSFCENLSISATDIPEMGKTLFNAFCYCTFEEIPGIENWDVSSVTDISSIFEGASNFTGDLSGWDVSSVTNMNFAFYEAGVFTSDLSGWNTANVTDMSFMFCRAALFESDLSSWKTGAVTDMSNMFSGASVFESDISGWYVSSVTDMLNMFYSIALSTENYDALLIAWAQQPVQSNVQFNAGGSTYSAAGDAEDARQTLVDTYGWIITDGGPN